MIPTKTDPKWSEKDKGEYQNEYKSTIKQKQRWDKRDLRTKMPTTDDRGTQNKMLPKAPSSRRKA